MFRMSTDPVHIHSFKRHIYTYLRGGERERERERERARARARERERAGALSLVNHKGFIRAEHKHGSISKLFNQHVIIPEFFFLKPQLKLY